MNKQNDDSIKIGIRTKIIISYISIVLVMALFSLMFITMFYESFMLSDARDKLEKEAKDFATLLRQDTQYNVIGQIMLNKKLGEFNYSLIIMSTEGKPLFTYNTEAVVDDLSKFCDTTSGYISHYGSTLINYSGRDYAAYIQPVRDMNTGAMLGYVIPFYSTRSLSLSGPLLTFYILTIVIAANFAIIIGAFLSGTLTKNIKKLKIRANMLANRRFDVTLPIDSHDEIEELSKSFDVMAQSIKEYDIKQKTFLQNASHEFRTPITSIRGYVEGVRDGVFDVPKATDMILEQVGRLEGLVEEIIFLSKLETADGIYDPQQITANELISEVTSRTTGMLLHSGTELKTGPIPDVSFVGDCDKLTTVITNLISNSVRFAKHEISMDCRTDASNLYITVSDDGPGIADKDMDKLFVRFYKGQKGNHGLGLSIAKAIMTSHNGDIRAYNKEEKSPDGTVTQITGAAFEIRIPLNNAPEAIR